MENKVRPALLLIFDGWGLSDNADHNAIHAAKTPVWDRLWATYPHTVIRTSGSAVGLPGGQMGNSEVGTENFLKNFNFIFSFQLYVTEFEEAVADIVLPDACFLERYTPAAARLRTGAHRGSASAYSGTWFSGRSSSRRAAGHPSQARDRIR